MVSGLQNINSDYKSNMKNKATLMTLAVAVCIIWTYIAIKLFSPSAESADLTPVPVEVSRPEESELVSLSLSPFIIPAPTTADPARKQDAVKRPQQPKNKSVRGRLIGDIEAGSICLSVVEIENVYHYISDGNPSKDCRIVKKYGEDSVCIVYSGDTLMLYKNDGKR